MAAEARSQRARLQVSRALNGRPRVLGLDPFVFWTLLGLVALSAISGSLRGMGAAMLAGAVLRVVQPLVEGGDPRRVEVIVRGLLRPAFLRPLRSAWGPSGPRRVR